MLGFRAAEVAKVLETTEESVTSALKRARAALARDLQKSDQPPPPPNSPAERRVLGKLVDAFERGDVDGIVSLMTEDAWVRMPPIPLEYQGRKLAGRVLATVAVRGGRPFRFVPTCANRSLAVPDPRSSEHF